MRGRRVRLFLRLTADVNDRLRALMRYHGELSRYIDDALTSLDLASIELMPVSLPKRTRGITAFVSGSANTRVRAAAKQRGCTVTTLANLGLTVLAGNRNLGRNETITQPQQIFLLVAAAALFVVQAALYLIFRRRQKGTITRTGLGSNKDV